MIANDAGDRITPAVVAYRDDEQVFLHVSCSHLQFLTRPPPKWMVDELKVAPDV